jgi:hypothetical protein
MAYYTKNTYNVGDKVDVFNDEGKLRTGVITYTNGYQFMVKVNGEILPRLLPALDRAKNWASHKRWLDNNDGEIYAEDGWLRMAEAEIEADHDLDRHRERGMYGMAW